MMEQLSSLKFAQKSLSVVVAIAEIVEIVAIVAIIRYQILINRK